MNGWLSLDLTITFKLLCKVYTMRTHFSETTMSRICIGVSFLYWILKSRSSNEFYWILPHSCEVIKKEILSSYINCRQAPFLIQLKPLLWFEPVATSHLKVTLPLAETSYRRLHAYLDALPNYDIRVPPIPPGQQTDNITLTAFFEIIKIVSMTTTKGALEISGALTLVRTI